MLKLLKQFKDVKVFLIIISIVFLVAIAVIFTVIYIKEEKAIIFEVKEQAVSSFDLIVRARVWNARYDGVYVEKKGEVQSNPYLKVLGVKSDIKCEGNRIFAIRAPALMTKEISHQPGEIRDLTFHMTSLKPINPENAPDSFKRAYFSIFNHILINRMCLSYATTPHIAPL